MKVKGCRCRWIRKPGGYLHRAAHRLCRLHGIVNRPRRSLK